jgi:hypothetical protein
MWTNRDERIFMPTWPGPWLATQVPVVVKEKQEASDKSRALRLFGLWLFLWNICWNIFPSSSWVRSCSFCVYPLRKASNEIKSCDPDTHIISHPVCMFYSCWKLWLVPIEYLFSASWRFNNFSCHGILLNMGAPRSEQVSTSTTPPSTTANSWVGEAQQRP